MLETDWVLLAVLRRARGIRGEVMAESMGSAPERFAPGLNVSLAEPGTGEERPAEIEAGWVHNGRLVLKFCGVDTRTEAESLGGWHVRIPVDARPPAPEGQHYLSDLIGFEIVTRDSRLIGLVTAWYDYGGPALLAVKSGEKEVLIPLVPEICVQVDSAVRRITVELPEGLEDLNRG